jgi:hypothetical protein
VSTSAEPPNVNSYNAKDAKEKTKTQEGDYARKRVR